jgi:hypothetical protein
VSKGHRNNLAEGLSYAHTAAQISAILGKARRLGLRSVQVKPQALSPLKG